MTCLLFAFSATNGAAQETKKEEKGKLLERFALKTNAFEWLITVPNIQVAFDLTASPYNRSVILLGAKYNWNTYHKYVPYFVFNAFDLRPEYRYYYRTQKRPWKACYLGGYANYSTYSLKPGKIGRQGFQGGLGVSWGYEIPLYKYKRCAIDFELGFSAGLCFASDKAYRMDSETERYVGVPEEDRLLAVRPAVTELRAVFSLRPISVSEKYNKTREAEGKEDPFKQLKGDIDDAMLHDASLESFRQSIEYENNAGLYESEPVAFRQGYFAFVQEAASSTLEYINGIPSSDEKLKENGRKYLQSVEKRLYRVFAADERARIAALRKKSQKKEEPAKEPTVKEPKVKEQKAEEPKEKKVKEQKVKEPKVKKEKKNKNTEQTTTTEVSENENEQL